MASKIYQDQYGNPFTFVEQFTTQLTRLLARLHQEYFSNEPPPLNGRPSTSILTINNQNNLHQQQDQKMVHEQNIKVGDFITQLSNKIEELPKSQEKKSVLQ